MNLRKISFAIIFSIIAMTGFSQGYEIKVKLKDFPNAEIILAHHFASSIHPDDTLKLNSKGEGTFKGKEKLPGGMYLLFLPSKSYFDIFIDKDQVFSIENDTLDMTNNFKSTGSKENEVFYDYQRFIKKLNNTALELREKQKTEKEDGKKKITEQLKNINKEVTKKQDEIIKENPDLLFASFLKATREVSIPKQFLDEKNRVKKESVADYLYFFRMHYWDNFDFGDARLLRTPIYESKFKLYIEKIVPQMPDTMNLVIDYIMERVIPSNAEIREDYTKPEMEREKVYNNPKSNKELLRYVLITLHNHLAMSPVMGMEESTVYETYYYYTKYAVWSNKTYITKLKKDAITKTRLFKGKPAPDLTMDKLPKDRKSIDNLILSIDKIKKNGDVYYDKYKQDLKNAKSKPSFKADSARISQELVNNLIPLINKFNTSFGGQKTLYDLKSKYTLVWFWEENCSHCRKATPQLVEASARLKHIGLEVYAISIHSMTYDWNKTTKEIKKWLEFVNEYNMHNWNNLYDPYHSSKFRGLYDINSSPVPYLLDKDKKIIAKRVSVDQIVSIFLDEELFEISENNEGKAKLDQFKKFISHKNLGLREYDLIKQTLSRVLEEKDKSTMLSFIDKKIAEKEIFLEKELKSKLNSGVEVLKNYADTFFNANDIDFLIKVLKENLGESKEDKKVLKHFENRKKYKLE